MTGVGANPTLRGALAFEISPIATGSERGTPRDCIVMCTHVKARRAVRADPSAWGRCQARRLVR